MDLAEYIKQKTWYRQQSESCPYFIYLPCVGALKWLGQSGNYYWVCKSNETRAYLETETTRAMAEDYLKAELKQPGKVSKEYRKWVNTHVRYNQRIFNELSKLDLSKASSLALISLNRRLALGYLQMWDSFFIDIYDADAESFIEAELAVANITMEPSDKGVLLQPNQCLAYQREQLSLLSLVDYVDKNKDAANIVSYISSTNTLHRLELNSKLNNLIQSHINNYFWIRNSWANTEVLTKQEIVEQTNLLWHGPRRVSTEIKELHNYSRNIKNAKARLAKKYKLTTRQKRIFDFFALLALWRDERKVEVQKTNHYLQQLGTEIAKRSRLSWEQIKVVDPLAIKSIPVTKKFLNEQKDFFNRRAVICRANGRVINLLAKESALVERALELTFDTKVNELRGVIGCPGKVTAKVRIIKKKSQFIYMKPGDILVTAMTRPEFVPLMKIASAIVTDEGGVTSHAAVIARELGKPCIIGTKIATKVLRNGYMVEVNANHGVVKIKNK